MKRILLRLMPVVLAACASTPPPPPTDGEMAARGPDVTCEREVRTGTSLPTKRCRTVEQREADRRAVDGVRDAVRNTGPSPVGKAGP